MEVTRTKIDRSGLPDELLPMAKTHMRVEFSRDDEYIKGTIARAIDFFERTTELSVFPRTYDWVPGPGFAANGAFFWQVPFQPAPSKLVVKDADGLDVSSRYVIRGSDADGFGVRVLVPLDGQPSYAPQIAATVGYANIDAMPPGILSFILEAAMWFYENREIGSMPGADGVPYLNQLLTAYWVPKA